MGRKTKTIVVEAEGRDQGKMFTLNEMPPSQAEKWAFRALLALSKSGVEVPEDIASSGLAGVAALGIKAFSGLRFEDAEPLLDEMFAMVSYVPDPSKPAIKRGFAGVGPLIDDDIEEISTRLLLRKELFALHTSFFTTAAH
ncbi:hypothetical protein WCQ02_31020 [Paraburkholderia tropica]|uniref:hypothetical protein n=1 Tax=Paraburkholderia tropica TaxID=92647 RepID=UPI003017CBF7